jgi:hypothetical protein
MVAAATTAGPRRGWTLALASLGSRGARHGNRHLGRVTGLGAAADPVVSGAIVQGLSWQWIFWLRVPLAAKRQWDIA